MAINRIEASQQDKYLAFKNAFGMINHYEYESNFIAAYVIAFSILEDRIKAMYVVSFRHNEKREPKPEAINEGFSKLVNKIHRAQFITNELRDELKAEAINRNDLLHAAMWKVDTFTIDTVVRIKKLIRVVEKARREQKKKIGA